MRNIDNITAEAAARSHAGATMQPTRFADVINRYLGAAHYPDPYAVRPLPAPVPRIPVPNPTGGFVLAGVDDSPISCIAADHAAIEAELHGWDLRFVTVRRTGADESGEALLRRLTGRVRLGTSTVAVTGALAVGTSPAQVLLTEAAGAGLLVLGHWHGVTTTALGRSVAERVARHHPGPVLVVRMPGRPVGAEFGERPLVAAVDGSAPARDVAEFALAEARARGCDLQLLHVVGDRADLSRRLEIRDGVSVHHRIIPGDPTTALIEESGRAAAIVVGRYRQGGSVLRPAAGRLTHRALCPVFLVG